LLDCIQANLLKIGSNFVSQFQHNAHVMCFELQFTSLQLAESLLFGDGSVMDMICV